MVRAESEENGNLILVTPLTTPVFDFYWVVEVLTMGTSTLSQGKTSFNRDFSDLNYFYAEDSFRDF